ncbi:MAG: PKD domain-containing protein, partial [bacterium]
MRRVSLFSLTCFMVMWFLPHVWAVGFAPEGQPYLFSDDFNDGNDKEWTRLRGSWSVVDGIYYQSMTSINDAWSVAGDASWTDYAVQMKVKLGPSAQRNGTGFIFRALDNNNNILLEVGVGSNEIRFWKQASGRWSKIGSATLPSGVQAGVWYIMKVEVEGPHIRGYLDGENYLDVTDDSLANGEIGCNAGGEAWFDNVVVTSLGGPSTVTVTVGTDLTGRSFTVDGDTYSTTQVFDWESGSSHTIGTTSPQSGGAGIQYVFDSWSDGGAMNHNVAPTTNMTYTVSFNTQYRLTTAVNAEGAGSVSPKSDSWHTGGATITVEAIANEGYSFSYWSGDLTGSTNPAQLLMNGAKSVTANFTVVGDTTPPFISGVQVSNTTARGATIKWETDESATSQLEYGRDTNYGTLTDLASALVTFHSVVLSGLTPESTYHYRVRSKDAANNEAISDDYTFTTLPEGQPYLFSDDFNDGNDKEWTRLRGNWSVVDGIYYQSMTSINDAWSVAGDASWTDYTVQMKVKLGPSAQRNGTGLIFRARDNNKILLEVGVGSNEIRFWKQASGRWSKIGSATLPSGVQAGVWYIMKVEVEGPHIRGYFEGKNYLEVTDNSLAQGKIGCNAGGEAWFDDVVVTPLGGANQSPVANASGPYSANEGSPVTLDASASTDDGSIDLYEWDTNNDATYDVSTSDSITSYIWTDDYKGLIVLKVTDDGGLSDTATAPVTINNVAPTANAGGPYLGMAGSPVSLSGSATDPGDDTFSYAWDLNEDGNFDDSTEQNPSYTWNEEGTYVVSLRVNDDDGGIDIATSRVVISPLAPPAGITPQPGWPVVCSYGNKNYTAVDYSPPLIVKMNERDELQKVVVGVSFNWEGTCYGIESNFYRPYIFLLEEDGGYEKDWFGVRKEISYLAAGDIDNDGTSEIVGNTAYRCNYQHSSCDHCVRYDQALTVNDPDTAFLLPHLSDCNSSVGYYFDTHSPVLANMDSDKAMEMATATYTWSSSSGDTCNNYQIFLYAVNKRETAPADECETTASYMLPGKWPVSIISSAINRGDHKPPVLSTADINKDGLAEIVIGTATGKLAVYKTNGDKVQGWPVEVSGKIMSWPAVGDVNRDNWLEIIAVTDRGNLYAFRHNGDPLFEFPGAVGENPTSPALGDIDSQNQTTEIVITAGNRLYVFDHQGVPLPSPWPIDVSDTDITSPIIADVDNDGRGEVIVGCKDGKIYAFNGDGTSPDGWPIEVGTPIYLPPAIGNIDEDDHLELIVCSKNQEVTDTEVKHRIYGYDLGGSRYKLDALHWPMSRHDSQGTSLFGAPTITLTGPPKVGGDHADQSYTIRWQDSDPDNNATISLYYDTDQEGLDGTLIASGLSEDEETDAYTANTSALTPGLYYLYAKIEDGVNPPVYDYSLGHLLVVHGNHSITLTLPQKDVTVSSSYTITWQDEEPDADTAISLYYDTDPEGYDGDLIVSGLSEDDETDAYIWDVSSVDTPGVYYVYAKLDNGADYPYYAYAEGSIQVIEDTPAQFDEELVITLTSPAGGNRFNGSSIYVSGLVSNIEATVTVRSTNNGSLIAELPAEVDKDGRFSVFGAFLSKGRNIITAEAVDADDNHVVGSVWVIYDPGLLGYYLYNYNDEGDLISVCNPMGHVNSREYKYHQLIRVVDARGNEERIEYDRAGRVVYQETKSCGCVGGSGSDSRRFTYQPNQTIYVDGRGNKTTYAFNTIDQTTGERKTTITDALGNITTNHFNQGRLVSTTDARRHTTTYGYDADGNRTSITDALNNVTNFTYESTYNQIATITDPLRHTTTFDY